MAYSPGEIIDLSKIYRPCNSIQQAYHQSPARHKLLIGGYGGGKTYPSMMEAFRHMFRCPGHQFAVFRNTKLELEDSIEKDMVEFAVQHGLAKPGSYAKSTHDMILINGLNLVFRPLTMERARAKGMNLCGFLVDDPDVNRYEEMLTFLFTRLRNKHTEAPSFISLWTANYEGRDYLWRTFMRGKQAGDCDMSLYEDAHGNMVERDPYAFWLCKTADNPTLPNHYISDLEKNKSESWMKRYVYMTDLDEFSGLVYPDFNPDTHHLDMAHIREGESGLIRIMSVDNGYHNTAVLKMATDGEKIFLYDEMVAHGWKTSQLGEYLSTEASKENYRVILIDPASGRSEQGTGLSTKAAIRSQFGVPLMSADNAVKYGIQLTQDFIMPASKTPRFFVDTGACPVSTKELCNYKYKEPRKTGAEEVEYQEDVVKRDDHCADAARYGIMFLSRYVNRKGDVEGMPAYRDMDWENKVQDLPLYRKNPRLAQAVANRRVMVRGGR